MKLKLNVTHAPDYSTNLNGNIKGKNYFNSKTKTHTRFDCLLQYKL